jgi:allophanate hydrolase subunit 2
VSVVKSVLDEAQKCKIKTIVGHFVSKTFQITSDARRQGLRIGGVFLYDDNSKDADNKAAEQFGKF